MRKKEFIHYLSWTATILAILMYVSYIPQIMDNLNGEKGNPIQPLVAGINCSLWVAYGILKKPRDLPLSIANFPGIIFGFVAFFTAL
ncbi:SemiSWEET family transporter [Carnobacterium divergens]|uniref:SemiSWEET family transporter n=1 Tax=Carnobacterium divergens TaxID=2748 RepID=A0AAW8RDH4_CARDV|nr:SemiSWEET family transporter [Carnobacterium divergens]MDT1958997.1 SemiSWEET family transporter [Carnobacterium divergens]MDT1974965.1 SemiSWEET family transporter [Carnobacterium divergens]MDT2012929.1 SemiSWEET family transporter [Carnobacterium divergens]